MVREVWQVAGEDRIHLASDTVSSLGAVAGVVVGNHTRALPSLDGFFTSEDECGGIGPRKGTKMRIELRSALVGGAAAIALLAVPGAALASQGDDASIDSSYPATTAMSDMPPGMQIMMSSPGHERFMTSPGHEHVMTSPGHQAMMD